MSTTNSKWLPPQQEGCGPWIEFTGPHGERPVPGDTLVGYLLADEREAQQYNHSVRRADRYSWGDNICAAYCVKLDGLQPQQPAASDRPAATPEQAPDTALAVQVAGDHYKRLAIQPIEYIHANGIGFAEGSVIKYVTRWRDKAGITDLKKARHFLDLLIELEEKKAGAA